MATELKINGVIRPINTSDETHEDIYGKGGYVTVDDITARNGIPQARRKLGMIVNVVADGIWYKLVGGIANTNWSTDIAGNILASGGLVTDMSDVSSAGAGIIPSMDDNTKLANIPLLLSAGYREDTYFVQTTEYEAQLESLPTIATVFNIIDTLANLALLPPNEPEIIDVGTIVHVLEDNTTYQATSINPNVWGLYESENDYLTETDAATTYLSKVDAIADYLSKADAATTYLSKVDAIADYLSKVDAGTTYLSKVDAIADYLTKTDASSLYPTQISTIPASNGASGVKGQYVFDTANGFRYDCIATDTWVRTVIVTTF